MLRDKLLDDELVLISPARPLGVAWTRVADALELKSRQSAERRHLRLRQAIRADGSRPRTQNERVEHTRERPDRPGRATSSGSSSSTRPTSSTARSTCRATQRIRGTWTCPTTPNSGNR